MRRKELYDLVWAEPTRTVAKRFGISDVALHKTCQKANIPTPGVGYWAKKAVGKKVSSTPLPPREIGCSDEVHVGPVRGYAFPASDLDTEDAPPPVFDEPIDAVRERVRRRVKRVSVPSLTSNRLHPATRQLLGNDRRLMAKNEGTSFAWYKPIFQGRVGQRRLSILNALFLALTSAGARPDVGRRQEPEIRYSVGHQDFCLRLEPTDGPKHGRWNEMWVTRPAQDDRKAILRLDVGHTSTSDRPARSWTDSDTGRLEKRLDEIVVDMIVLGEERHRNWELQRHELQIKERARQRQERAKAAIEAERKERERRARFEKRQIETLLADARARLEAQEIRSLVEEVRSIGQLPHMNADEIEIWASWALAQAERHDPLTNQSLKMLVDDGT